MNKKLLTITAALLFAGTAAAQTANLQSYPGGGSKLTANDYSLMVSLGKDGFPYQVHYIESKTSTKLVRRDLLFSNDRKLIADTTSTISVNGAEYLLIEVKTYLNGKRTAGSEIAFLKQYIEKHGQDRVHPDLLKKYNL